MSRMLTAAAIAAAIAAPSGRTPQPAAAAKATIAQVALIGANWAGGGGPVTVEERWTPPAGGAMLGVSRTVRDGRMVEFEFLRIVERNGGLVYIAQPNGRPPTEFTLTAIGADSATFENPAHYYPKMIRYAKRADGGLDATISAGGSQRAQTFSFTRQAP